MIVDLNPSPATNAFIVANDRTFAQEVAMSKGRYSVFGCGG